MSHRSRATRSSLPRITFPLLPLASLLPSPLQSTLRGHSSLKRRDNIPLISQLSIISALLNRSFQPTLPTPLNLTRSQEPRRITRCPRETIPRLDYKDIPRGYIWVTRAALYYNRFLEVEGFEGGVDDAPRLFWADGAAERFYVGELRGFVTFVEEGGFHINKLKALLIL